MVRNTNPNNYEKFRGNSNPPKCASLSKWDAQDEWLKLFLAQILIYQYLNMIFA